MTTEKIKTTVEARGEAFDQYMRGCNHDNAGDPNYSPMSCCDVCRGRWSEHSFGAGYDAGLASAASRCLEFEAMVERSVKVVIGVKGDPDYTEIIKGDDGLWGLGSCGDNIPWLMRRFDSATDVYTALTATTEGKV